MVYMPHQDSLHFDNGDVRHRVDEGEPHFDLASEAVHIRVD